jgi:hypothetical protein
LLWSGQSDDTLPRNASFQTMRSAIMRDLKRAF